VLRFWETKFPFIRPMKRAGGRRFYRPSDIAVLKGVRRLLHDEGYTIKGVQRLHREQGVRRLVEAGVGGVASSLGDGDSPGASLAAGREDGLRRALAELEAAKGKLDGLLPH
jgi:DNA-binding transcriptional MerR regulator